MTSKMEWLDALVKQRPDLKDRTFKVAVCLAVYANGKDGENAHPGEKQLAAVVGISERRVRDHLDLLREAGWIRRVSRGSIASGRKWADVYALTIPARVGVRDADDHRTPECPMVDESPRDEEAVDHRTFSTDHRTFWPRPPDAQTSAHPGLAPGLVHPKNRSLASLTHGGGAPEPQSRDECERFDEELAWIEEVVGGWTFEEEVRASNMLDKGSDMHAVRNAILKKRREPMFRVPE